MHLTVAKLYRSCDTEQLRKLFFFNFKANGTQTAFKRLTQQTIGLFRANPHTYKMMFYTVNNIDNGSTHILHAETHAIQTT